MDRYRVTEICGLIHKSCYGVFFAVRYNIHFAFRAFSPSSQQNYVLQQDSLKTDCQQKRHEHIDNNKETGSQTDGQG